MDDLALRATAWLSIAAWAASEWLLSPVRGPVQPKPARASFTLGALALVLHTGLALHLRHAWSQADAMREIARQTAEVTGLGFSGGLFVNYAFLAFWLAEAYWWWRSPAGYLGRGSGPRWASRAVFLFMFVNGAIVFGHGPVRVFGAIAILAVCQSWYRAPTR
ncbi:MAG TPA: hypothetical protein VI669_04445 [Vicinamibacteria bacterium]